MKRMKGDMKGERVGNNTVLLIENKDLTVWRIERNAGRINLVIDDDRSIDDIYELCLLAIGNKSLDGDREFWKLKINEADKAGCNPITLIYYLTGGDKIWKHNKQDVWAFDWAKIGTLLLNQFGDRIKKILQNCKTLQDLRSRILEGPISPELFYDYGLKIGAIRQEEI